MVDSVKIKKSIWTGGIFAPVVLPVIESTKAIKGFYPGFFKALKGDLALIREHKMKTPMALSRHEGASRGAKWLGLGGSFAGVALGSAIGANIAAGLSVAVPIKFAVLIATAVPIGITAIVLSPVPLVLGAVLLGPVFAGLSGGYKGFKAGLNKTGFKETMLFKKLKDMVPKPNVEDKEYTELPAAPSVDLGQEKKKEQSLSTQFDKPLKPEDQKAEQSPAVKSKTPTLSKKNI